MILTDWEKAFLKYYNKNHNAKWMQVFNNKHPILETNVILYSIYKRKLKKQPIVGQETFTSMFQQLKEGDWYSITNLLLNSDKERL